MFIKWLSKVIYTFKDFEYVKFCIFSYNLVNDDSGYSELDLRDLYEVILESPERWDSICNREFDLLTEDRKKSRKKELKRALGLYISHCIRVTSL